MLITREKKQFLIEPNIKFEVDMTKFFLFSTKEHNSFIKGQAYIDWLIDWWIDLLDSVLRRIGNISAI